jgi:Ca2+-binding EF-hand superfamily protein
VQRREFPALLRNIYYFSKLWEVFEDIDTGDDRRIDLEEFKRGISKLGVTLSDADAAQEFSRMDRNGGGQVLFDEFCKHVAQLASGDPAAMGKTPRKPSGKNGSSSSLAKNGGLSIRGQKTARSSSVVQKAAAASARARNSARGSAKATARVPAFIAAARTVEDEQLERVLSSKDELRKLWKQLDFNGNGICSLAEIDKMIVSVPGFEKFNNKPALMRAYKRTTSKAGGGDGDDWVEKREFAALLRNIYYFNKLWDAFEDVDSDHDRRIDAKEFHEGCQKLGSQMSFEEAEAEFNKMDRNGGGQVLFDEFCVYYGRMASGKGALPRKAARSPGRRVAPQVPSLGNLSISGRRPVSRMGAARAAANRRSARPQTAAGRMTGRPKAKKKKKRVGALGRPYQRRPRPNHNRLFNTRTRKVRDPERHRNAASRLRKGELAPYHGPLIVVHKEKD